MKFKNLAMVATVSVAALSVADAASARDQIQIVGSSTVFPFATAVAERFGATTDHPTPVIESTGSGGGFKLFCTGVGVGTPDVTNASRPVKESEFETCTKNGITMTEIIIGFDGIVLANSKEGPDFKLSGDEIYLALAAEVPDENCNLVKNPYTNWSEINKDLPNEKITVLGPPPTSGTRDAFVELGMEGSAKKNECMAKLRKDDKSKFGDVAGKIREDGAFVDAGENDNLIVKKLIADKTALGIFGFSFLDNNRDKIKGAELDGNMPEFELIANGEYELSRSLQFYVKREHVDVIPGMKEYVVEFTSEKAIGNEGYLIEKGLIPLPEDRRKVMRERAEKMTELTKSDLR